MARSVGTEGGMSKKARETAVFAAKCPIAGAQARCYVCAAMAETTTIRLPPKLRARLRAIAKETDRSVHSLIVEAVEKHAAYEEQMRSLVKEALAADAEIDHTGEVYRAADVHAWAARLASGVETARPKPWRK
jgi:predicted transcriptional regulator